MRVAHVVRNLHDGGMERIVAELVAELAELGGLDLHVVSFEPGGRFVPILDGRARVHVAPGGGSLSMIRPARLARALADLDADVVHAHSGTWFKTARAARIARARAVAYTEHGRHLPDPLSNRLIDAAAARFTDRVIAVSSPLRDYLVERVHVPRGIVRVIVNGIDVDAIRRIPARPELVPGGSARPFTFVTVGRIEPVKGLEQLVEVMRGWPEDAPECRIVFAGEGSERPRLEAEIAQAGLGDRFHFAGWVDEPAALLKAADAYLLPSYSEGTSISLLEAMACGCPPIASAVGGNAEILGEELREWLVPARDVSALRDRMVRLARSPELRARVERSAEARVRAVFSRRGMARAYAELYKEMLSNAR